MSPGPFLILGCGYTGRRVAQRLAARGCEVWATARNSPDLSGVRGLRLDTQIPSTLATLAHALPDSLTILHSLPVPDDLHDVTGPILGALGQKTKRIVYLSTTGVYGAQREVDEHSPAVPLSPSSRQRVRTEDLILNGGPWSGMVLRPAAIYGPGRGAHISIPRGTFQLAGDGMNFVSRIHVDDLAALTEAALFADAAGAWPVADEEPARSRDVAAFVSELLGCAMPQSLPKEQLHETRRADRRVDGRAVCRLLAVRLQYPSYRLGIPASL
ncbi:NAD-dependent epimerase/dehydratase family protein [Paludibaculum fermentans]|uniref:NAD-dependent epimerase/dehydratase family protein n=1 Tax=Paludibaculum fermentans TaxID=1473598 RepID=UPI003EC11801